VVAVPPDLLGEQVAAALRDTDAVVTDVGSVKTAPLGVVRALARAPVGRYVGSHPMAGSERSGPFAASASLFDGRPWAVTPHESALPEAVEAVTELDRLCEAEARRRAGTRLGPPVRGAPGHVLPRGARPGGGADLAPAAPPRGRRGR